MVSQRIRGSSGLHRVFSVIHVQARAGRCLEGAVKRVLDTEIIEYPFIHRLRNACMAPVLRCSVTNFKLGLALHHLSVFLVQLDYVGVPWPLVDVFEEGCDGILLALGFSLDLRQYR
jgi:hypothetical protein